MWKGTLRKPGQVTIQLQPRDNENKEDEYEG